MDIQPISILFKLYNQKKSSLSSHHNKKITMLRLGSGPEPFLRLGPRRKNPVTHGKSFPLEAYRHLLHPLEKEAFPTASRAQDLN